METRAVLAKLITHFDLSFPASYDDSQFDEETKDHISLKRASLTVICLSKEVVIECGSARQPRSWHFQGIMLPNAPICACIPIGS